MAKLIGYLMYGHHAGTIHRLAHKEIESKLATWKGSTTTILKSDGMCKIYVNGELIYNKNINIK